MTRGYHHSFTLRKLVTTPEKGSLVGYEAFDLSVDAVIWVSEGRQGKGLEGNVGC